MKKLKNKWTKTTAVSFRGEKQQEIASEMSEYRSRGFQSRVDLVSRLQGITSEDF